MDRWTDWKVVVDQWIDDEFHSLCACLRACIDFHSDSGFQRRRCQYVVIRGESIANARVREREFNVI